MAATTKTTIMTITMTTVVMLAIKRHLFFYAFFLNACY